jgi:hypothetical protein
MARLDGWIDARWATWSSFISISPPMRSTFRYEKAIAAFATGDRFIPLVQSPRIHQGWHAGHGSIDVDLVA